MSRTITYVDGKQMYRVVVDCNRVQAGRIAKLLPEGALVDASLASPRDPERAAVLAVLIVRSELQRIAGGVT